MNALSLAYSSAQKQHQEPSWSDDPFDFKGFVTGVTKVSDHVRNLNDYTQELVSSYAKLNGDQYELDLDKLSSPCQLELARLYIESIDREIEWACYGDDESLNSSFLCAMLAMLKNDCEETRNNFAEVTRKNILVYYKESLDKILETAYDNYINAINDEHFYYEQDLNA